jgi:uncharacterized membrane protein YqgA involved in biofilm formation
MERKLPVELLQILEKWFSISVTCVKWGRHVSQFFKLRAGVRQDGVLLPFLFAVFIDNFIDRIKSVNMGCYISFACLSVFMCANDILLVAPSVTALQTRLIVCENELNSI